MTPAGARRFRRRVGERPYRRVFVLATEGRKTEPAYFDLFRSQPGIHITHLPTGGASSPTSLLQAMRRYLRDNALRGRDEAWIIVDTDSWTAEQLQAVHDWSREASRHGLAVSNPMFEYWLLLHFEDGNDIVSARACLQRLVRHLPEYDKGALPGTKIRAGIDKAVERARRRDTPPRDDWPHQTGTTVYRLVERLRVG
jgi:hypothetical protein